MFPVALMLVFSFRKLIDTIVELVDLQRFPHEFCAFLMIMRRISVTKTTDYGPGHYPIRDTH